MISQYTPTNKPPVAPGVVLLHCVVTRQALDRASLAPFVPLHPEEERLKYNEICLAPRTITRYLIRVLIPGISERETRKGKDNNPVRQIKRQIAKGEK